MAITISGSGITSANIADGTITTDDILASDVVSLKSGRKNLIINGTFNINERGYTSGAATTVANQYTLDRWRVVTSGQALAFSATENVQTCTLPVAGIEQVIEGANIFSGTYTISFVATGDTVCTVDTVVKATGDTFTLTGGTNATILFKSASGTGTVKLVQVELGSVATDFEYRSYGEELALCQRYYLKIFSAFLADSTNGFNFNLQFPVPMRVSPTSTHSYNGVASNFYKVSTGAVIQFVPDGIFRNVNGLTTGYDFTAGYIKGDGYTTNWEFSAEL